MEMQKDRIRLTAVVTCDSWPCYKTIGRESCGLYKEISTEYSTMSEHEFMRKVVRSMARLE